MGICYSQQQQWEAYNKAMREKRNRRKKPKQSSIIYEEKSIYESSFASNVENSFRQDLHHTISQIANENGSIAIGSIVEMKQEELDILYSSLQKINAKGEPHNINDPITLCNLKTKNFLHTHKIKITNSNKLNQVSCCPYNSNHIIEYDIWKFIKCQSLGHQVDQSNEEFEEEQLGGEIDNQYYIYHPFTQRFLNQEKGQACCSQEKKRWRIHTFGPRRNGGFIRIYCDQGELCMAESKALLQNHRKLQICTEKHISHLWEISCAQIQ